MQSYNMGGKSPSQAVKESVTLVPSSRRVIVSFKSGVVTAKMSGFELKFWSVSKFLRHMTT